MVGITDIMKKRICDYRSRKRWKAQSLGGTDAQKKMAAILEPRQRDSVAEAKSAWERHPNLEDQVILNLRSKMEAKAFCILNRRRTENPPTLQARRTFSTSMARDSPAVTAFSFSLTDSWRHWLGCIDRRRRSQSVLCGWPR